MDTARRGTRPTRAVVGRVPPSPAPARRTRRRGAREADPPVQSARGGPADHSPRTGTLVAPATVTVSRAPRLQCFEYRGRYSYFLTFCTDQRRRRFIDASVSAMVVRQILRAAKRFEFEILAYCVMPDHVHALVHGTSDGADLRRFMKRVKQSSGQIYRRWSNEALWQEGYYDRVVRPEEDLSGIVRYIVENPVREGLVKSPLEYQFVGSTVWALEELVQR